MELYRPGGPQGALTRRSFVHLASNENPLGPSPRAVEALVQAAGGVHRYPEMFQTPLREALGATWGLPPEQLVVGNGVDQLIKLLAEAFLDPGQEAVFPAPSFSAYRQAALLVGGTPRAVALTDDRLDLAAMLRAVTERTRLVFICNPNNPTGTAVTAEPLRSFLRDLPGHALAVLDEAYAEYVEDPAFLSGLTLLREGRQLVTLRTFSKIYGLAGLRIGWAAGPENVAQALMKVREPFSVNRLAEVAAVAALEDAEHLERSRRLVAEGRAQLMAGLQALGYRPVPSQANFILVDVGEDSAQMALRLREQGILVRDGGPFGLTRQLRITVGTREENAALLVALGEVRTHEPVPTA